MENIANYRYTKNEESLIIKLNGSDEIDLYSFQNIITNTAEILKIIADKTIEENQYCKFKITKIEKGSFIMTISSIFENTIIPILPEMPTVLSTLKTCLDIKKHLGGKDPKTVEVKENGVFIENNYGTINQYNIASSNIYFNSNDIETAASKLLTSIAKDEDRTGIEITINDLHENSETISFDAEELPKYSKPLDVEKYGKEFGEDVNEVTIRVIKIDLEGTAKWQCYYGNTKITADIKDEEFLRKVHNGEISFSNRTKMRVLLRIRYQMINGVPDTNKKMSHTIVKVIEVINNENDQTKLPI